MELEWTGENMRERRGNRPCLWRILEKIQMNSDLKRKNCLKLLKIWILTFNDTHFELIMRASFVMFLCTSVGNVMLIQKIRHVPGNRSQPSDPSVVFDSCDVKTFCICQKFGTFL